MSLMELLKLGGVNVKKAHFGLFLLIPKMDHIKQFTDVEIITIRLGAMGVFEELPT